MTARSWGHRERLLALGAFGVLLAVCGAAATATGAPSGPGLTLAGAALGCWEALGLWLYAVYGRQFRKDKA
ncbi:MULTISPECIES: hypothetical protein [unclassified Streptomyces]|jgi:hypothetical protein|uniref:hypothetical protein n=1 Tax=unclassified Streptomyces TaxID=2593676 RepID=UPI00034E0043|nr:MULTISPECIES: hypothetical protein [unclassified Streptomyces]EPD66702.1 hypothetical protein HMPREF1211_00957 [Streptomyces sp. HGB0020]WUB34203.1 hypothetical protein OHN38_04530 [Streptomyces sp. NBC_00588]